MGLFMIKFSFFLSFKTILVLVYVSFKKKSKMTIIFYHMGLVIFVNQLLATNLRNHCSIQIEIRSIS